jgi:hypothetical protein
MIRTVVPKSFLSTGEVRTSSATYPSPFEVIDLGSVSSRDGLVILFAFFQASVSHVRSWHIIC